MTTTLAGRYERGALVAEGPLGALYRGRTLGDAGFSRPVAVRAIAREWAAEGRFARVWAAVASELAETGSPHVEQVLDVVEGADGVHVITEWIEGVSLPRLMAHVAERGEPFPWPLALEIAIPVLRALAPGHAQKSPLCHGGLAPSAVRIAAEGTVKLTRFGMAPGLAATGVDRGRRGTLGLRHPAPELKTGEEDARTDQHGVGALLYVVLAGRPLPSDRAAPDELPDLCALRPDVPPLLAACVERALRADPIERFPSVEHLERALGGLLRTSDAPQLRERVAAVPPRPGAEARPKGLPAARTVVVDPRELTELSTAPQIAIAPARTRPYQFDLKRRGTARAEEAPAPPPLPPRVPASPEDDSEAAPVPLTTLSGGRKKRPELGLPPAQTEMLDEEELRRVTIDPAAQRPLGLAPASTEYLADGELDQLRIDDD